MAKKAKTNSFDNWHSFTAIRGVQAGREYYVAMCPLKVIPRIFLFDEIELNPELRAQRTLNRARLKKWRDTSLKIPEPTNTFSSITASVDVILDLSRSMKTARLPMPDGR